MSFKGFLAGIKAKGKKIQGELALREERAIEKAKTKTEREEIKAQYARRRAKARQEIAKAQEAAYKAEAKAKKAKKEAQGKGFMDYLSGGLSGFLNSPPKKKSKAKSKRRA